VPRQYQVHTLRSPLSGDRRNVPSVNPAVESTIAPHHAER
jgi:hypothetical protein